MVHRKHLGLNGIRTLQAATVFRRNKELDFRVVNSREGGRMLDSFESDRLVF